jgi:hypothetical protein
MSELKAMEKGRERWQMDNLIIAAVGIIGDAILTTKPLTRKAFLKAIEEECTNEPKTLAVVTQMLVSMWNGIKFEE